MLPVYQSQFSKNSIIHPILLSKVKDSSSQNHNGLERTELKILIDQIIQGRFNIVVLNKRKLNNQQFIEVIIACCHPNANVEEIDASNNEITASAIKEVVPYLSNNNRLKKLNLASNNINCAVLDDLLEILSKNTFITSISLHKNPIDRKKQRLIRDRLDQNKLYATHRIKVQEEIMEELKRKEHYNCIFIVLSIYNLPVPVCRMVLDYYNNSTTIEARKAIAESLYPILSGHTMSIDELQITESCNPSSLSNRLQLLTQEFNDFKTTLDVTEQDEQTNLLSFTAGHENEKTKDCADFIKSKCTCVLL